MARLFCARGKVDVGKNEILWARIAPIALPHLGTASSFRLAIPRSAANSLTFDCRRVIHPFPRISPILLLRTKPPRKTENLFLKMPKRNPKKKSQSLIKKRHHFFESFFKTFYLNLNYLLLISQIFKKKRKGKLIRQKKILENSFSFCEFAKMDFYNKNIFLTERRTSNKSPNAIKLLKMPGKNPNISPIFLVSADFARRRSFPKKTSLQNFGSMNSSSSSPNSTSSFSSPFSLLPIWLANTTGHLFPNTSLAFRLYHRLDLANLRRIFYLTSPWESAFARLDEVPNYNVQVSAWWMTLITAEFVVLAFSGHSGRFALNDSITSVCAGMCSQCFKFGGRAVAIFGYIWIWDNFRLFELPWDSVWTWAICLVTQDFAYYLGHRAIHEAGVFWGLHTIHHSSQFYNLSTALRQAAIQDAGLAFYDCAQAFFIPPPIFLVHRYFSEIFQFWMHTSLLGSLGPLGWVLNTPSHHRVHHGRNPYCIDRNFGGVLIIWDRMFGTFEAERPNDPPIYGLVKNENSFNQIWLQFHTLKELLLDKWRQKDEKGAAIFPGVLDKLKAMYFPPGWFPGVPVRPFFHWFSLVNPAHDVPVPECPPIVYNPPIPPWLKAYLFGHFLLLLAIFLHFEYDRDELDWLDFCLKLAFFLCTMQSFGAFFDLRPWAPFLELFRCIGVLLYYSTKMALESAGIRPNRLFVGSLFAGFSIFWLTYISVGAFRAWRNGRRRKVGMVEANAGERAKEENGQPMTTVCARIDDAERRRRRGEEQQRKQG